MNRRAEALNPAAEQTLRAPKYEASSIFTLVAQSERYLYPIYLSLISFRRDKIREIILSYLLSFRRIKHGLNPLLKHLARLATALR